MVKSVESGREAWVWAKRFKEARVSTGLSQKAVGVLAGLDQFVASTRINRYEVGVHEPDFQLSIKLAKILKVPVAYLYCEDDELARVLLEFSKAPPSVRARVTELLDGG